MFNIKYQLKEVNPMFESVDHRRDGSFVVATEDTVYVFQALGLAK